MNNELIIVGDGRESKSKYDSLGLAGLFEVEIIRGGNVVDIFVIPNLVTNAGYDEILDKFWRGANYTASLFVGLISSSPVPVVGDTMLSHGAWTEIAAYSETVRQTLIMGAVADQSTNNSANKASFSIDTNSQNIGGAFICTDNTKNGTGGVLIAAAAFTEDKGVGAGDTFNFTYTNSKA